MVKQTLAAALVAVAAVTTSAAAAPVRTMYNDAMAKEVAVRKALENPQATEAILKAVHEVVESYEAVVRRYPASSYCDNALWQAGKLSLDAFARFNQPRDQDAGERLLRKLVAMYPSSKLARQVRLADAPAIAVARSEPTITPPTKPEPEKTAATKSEAPKSDLPKSELSKSEIAKPETTESRQLATKTASGVRTIRDIRRTVLGDAVRVVIELDGEVAFHEERIADPSRVFVDMPGTRAATTLQDQTLRFEGDADVVRQVRIGRHPNNTTRVVLDANGVSSYSVYPLYNPYRVVIDCVRTTPVVSTTAAAVPATKPAPPAIANIKPATPLVARIEPAAPPPPTPVTRPAPAAMPTAPPTTPAARPAPTATPTPPPAALTPMPFPMAVPVRREPALIQARRLKTPLLRSAPGISPQHGVLLAEARIEPTIVARKLPLMATAAPYTISKSFEPPPPPAPAPAPPPPALAPLAATASAATLHAIAPLPPPDRNTTGGLSIARQLGLGVSRIVIDAGHGGHDPGAKGKGVTEAELVLDVALRLEALLQKVPGIDVILTRRTDDFIQLPDRTALANREGADLFLSIHANASINPQARGLETYFLNFATNLSAAAVAARENASSTQAMGALPDFVKAIALNNKLDESRDFATAVQHAMVEELRTANKTVRDLGVKQAPFVVLIGAVMPSVLAEISFVTNPQEAKLVKNSAYRQKIAEALFTAIRKYQTSLKTGVAVTTQR